MAEITGGGLHFESTLDNEKLNRAIDETMRRIQGLSDGTKTAGEVLENAFDSAGNIAQAAGLDIEKAFAMIDQAADMNRQSVRELETEYARLSRAAGEAFTAGDDDAYRQTVRRQDAVKGEIAVRRQLLKELEQQADELSKIEQAYEKQRQKQEQNANSQVSMRTRIRELREEMMRLIDEGIDEQSEAYQRLKNELGRLTDIQMDVQQQARVLANDEQLFQGLISGLSGIAGGFSAATGAISMFAGKNEDLQKVMTRVQSVMAITIGLQQVSVALNKDSAFQLVTVTRAKNMLAAATNRLSVALGISNAAAKALMATLTLGLSLAITGIIVLTERYISKTRAAKKEQEEFFKAIADGAYKPIGAITQLSEKWAKLGEDLKAKKKFIDDNQQSFDDLGATIRDVADAQKLLIDNKDAFINAQIAKAKALALVGMTDEDVKDAVQAKLDLDKAKMKPTINRVFSDFNARTSTVETVVNPDIAKYEKKLDEANKRIKQRYDEAAKYEEEGAELLTKVNEEATNTYAKTIEELEKQISKKNAAIKKMSDVNEIRAAQKEIEALQKEVERMTGKGSETKTTDRDPFVEMLQKRKKAYSDYETWLNSTDASIRSDARTHFAELLKDGESYVEYLYAMRSRAMESGNQAQIKALNSMIAAEMQKGDDKEEEKQQEHIKKLIEDYGKYYDQRVKLHEEYLKDIELFNKQFEKETDPEKKAVIHTAIDNRRKTYDKDLKDLGSGDAEYDRMLKEYATFEQKKQAIIDDYNEKRKVAQEKGNTELIEQLNKAQAKALSSLATEELTGSEMWSMLFGNLDELTINQIDTLVNEIESKFNELSGVFDPIDLNAVRNKLNEARSVLIQDNPFKAIGDSLRSIFRDGASGSKDATRNIKTDWKNLASATQSAFDFVQDAVNSAEFLKDAIGDVGATAISSLASVAATSIAVATAISAAEKASVILTVIQAALSVVQAVANVITSIIRQKDKQIEKQIQRHAENVDRLQRSYEKLEKAIDKALGSVRYADTQKAIKNLEQQQEELAKQADLERSKKKTDKDKVREYENAIQDAKDKQKELIEQLREDILGLDARSAAEELGAAFVDAFREGEDALAAFGKKADDIVGNIMQKMLVQKLLEQPIGQIFDKYSKKWYIDNGDFIGFEAVIKDANSMGAEIKGVGEGFAKAMEGLPDEIKKYFIGDTAGSDTNSAGSDTNSWVGAIKGASEESVKFAAGQLNAMRINQLEATSLLRQQLAHLSTIAQNTAYNRYLKSIDERFARLENKPDSLRSQGLS